MQKTREKTLKDQPRGTAGVSRRQAVGALAAGAAVLACGSTSALALVPTAPSNLSLSLQNLHTSETFKGIFAEKGNFVPEALRELNHVLRDHRSGDSHQIDPALFVWMTSLRDRLGGGGFSIISGYRSPKSNASLRANSSGVAKKSLHMQGRAIDLRLAGVDTSNLRKLAIQDKKGGVGYYRSSDFVHLDTGRPRFW